MYVTYIIESERLGIWYYGHSSEVERRLDEHNAGRNKSTKNKGPWRLIFLRQFETKADANRFELELKRLKNKEYIKRTFRRFFIGM